MRAKLVDIVYKVKPCSLRGPWTLGNIDQEKLSIINGVQINLEQVTWRVKI